MLTLSTPCDARAWAWVAHAYEELSHTEILKDLDLLLGLEFPERP